MLNRRLLRVKAMQALYAFYQSDKKDVTTYEKYLLQNANNVKDSYIATLKLICEIADFSVVMAEEKASKHLPSEEDLNFSTRISTNSLILKLKSFALLNEEIKRINFIFERDFIKNLFKELCLIPEYKAYIQEEQTTEASDRKIIAVIVTKLLFKNIAIVKDEDLGEFENHYEAKKTFFEKMNKRDLDLNEFDTLMSNSFLTWQLDRNIVKLMVLKTIDEYANNELVENFDKFKTKHRFNNIKEASYAIQHLAPISINWMTDREFILTMYKKTISNNLEYQNLITNKTINWDSDRISLVDNILMKMAIAEIIAFPEIPVKVSLNEYLEIAKQYSTPKSAGFINGILDKIISDLSDNGKINKTGPGLK